MARRSFPEVTIGPEGPPLEGEWLFTTRPGAERDLMEELFFLDPKSAPRPAGASLVTAISRPRHEGRFSELAFARQGFAVARALTFRQGGEAAAADALARALAQALERATRKPRPFALEAWVPDADEANPLAAAADALREAIRAALARQRPDWAALEAEPRAVWTENGLYAQLCLTPAGAERRALLGVGYAGDAISLAPGGRLRVHVPQVAPSRAAMKLEEALTWLDRAPEPGDRCVDLGAAPGGWTWVLLERRARVLAVDPGALADSVRGRKGLEHVRGDAFRYEPPEPVDWLFCDMAYRPLEVAGLLAKWARRKWARFLVANIKLPMKQKAQMVARVRDILEDAGWKGLRARQLYHDREEITIAAFAL